MPVSQLWKLSLVESETCFQTHTGLMLKVGLAPRLLSPEYSCGGSVITKTKRGAGCKECTQQVIDV